MADLPESARWHPLKAAHNYELLAEEACGKAVMAFTEYARLRGEYVQRRMALNPEHTDNDLMYAWTSTDAAKSCVSDLTTYRDMAKMYAAMAGMKHTRYLSDVALRNHEDLGLRDL